MTQAQDPFSRAVNHLIQHYLPRDSHVPLYASLSPLITQLCFKVMRQEIRKKLMRNTQDKDFVVNTLNKRNMIIQGFLYLEALETVAFLALSLSNRYFLINAAYTCAHVAWTAYSFRHEGNFAPDTYRSMDGPLPFYKE